MATEITNTLRSSSIIRVTGASTATITLANLSSNVGVETVNSAAIKRVMWSTNGNITITRNSDVLLQLYGSGDFKLSDIGHTLSKENTSSIVITVTTGGTIFAEVTKQTTYSPGLIGM